jgi:alanine racemase
MTTDALSWLELSRSALLHNLAAARALAGSARLIPVLKANGYGAGAVGMAQTIATAGVDAFAVATVPEALELRAAGIRGMLLCLTYFTPSEGPAIVAHDVTPCVFTIEGARLLSAAASAAGRPLAVWVKVDTGLGRLGVRYPDAPAFVVALAADPWLRVSGLFSTIIENPARDEQQVQRLLSVRDALPTSEPLTFSIASSHALLSQPASALDAVRPGIMLLGLEPSERDRLDMRLVEQSALRYIATWKSRVGLVKVVPRGEQVGYGMQPALATDRKIASLPIGWADGCPPNLSQGGNVLIRGVRCPVLAVSANTTLVDTSDVVVALGDEAVLLGAQGAETITPYELARYTGSVYRLLTPIPRDVPRLWS